MLNIENIPKNKKIKKKNWNSTPFIIFILQNGNLDSYTEF